MSWYKLEYNIRHKIGYLNYIDWKYILEKLIPTYLQEKPYTQGSNYIQILNNHIMLNRDKNSLLKGWYDSIENICRIRI